MVSMVSTSPLSFLAARAVFACHQRTSLSQSQVTYRKVALVSAVDLLKYYFANGGDEQQILTWKSVVIAQL